MGHKETYRKLFFPIISRYLSTSKQQTTARSALVRFMENRRKKLQEEDIRLEPYVSKGVYTESGAIRPMPKRYPLGIVKVLLVTIPFIYLGALTSKYLALLLDKFEVFAARHDDDDDDDD